MMAIVYVQRARYTYANLSQVKCPTRYVPGRLPCSFCAAPVSSEEL